MEMLPLVSDYPPVQPSWFPTDWQAVLFRNWGIVPPERLGRILETGETQLREAAEALGLDPTLQADPRWLTRGYLTIIRNNWHLLTFEQIMSLLDIDELTFATLLKEDDFLWHKMGQMKPRVNAPKYCSLTEDQQARTREIAREMKQIAAPWQTETAFGFVDDFARPVSNKPDISAANTLRTVYSYFALYGDPLIAPELDPFPEALLSEYARMGVKGVWMQGILYQLVEFPFAPEMSSGWEMRLSSLNRLIQRAAKYGIGIYLYLNEPRSMPDAFFQKYPYLRGTREGDFYCMCTSQPEVQDYLYNATKELFTRARGLAGCFTISMSENLTNCHSRGPCTCPRCRRRTPWEVVAEVNNLIARGARAGNPDAKVVVWSWSWGDEWAGKVPPLLTEGQILQCTSEESMAISVGGVDSRVADYTLSNCGPSEKSKQIWATAHAHGLECCAKVQLNNTWEMSAVPWMPVFDKVAGHIRNLMDAGVRHLQYSWTLGGYPSPNLKLAGYLMDRRGDVESFCREWLGDDLGTIACLAQKRMSEAFSEFPFNIGTVYTAPMNYGPMAPFYLKPTGWKATMIGFPYDDLDTWRSIYPREIFCAQFQKLVDKWTEGVAFMVPREGENADFDEMLAMARGALIHFSSTLHQIKFVLAREAGDVPAMRAAIDSERANVLDAIRLRAADSRFGYEASNHYYYAQINLAEKLLNLKWCKTVLS